MKLNITNHINNANTKWTNEIMNMKHINIHKLNPQIRKKMRKLCELNELWWLGYNYRRHKAVTIHTSRFVYLFTCKLKHLIQPHMSSVVRFASEKCSMLHRSLDIPRRENYSYVQFYISFHSCVLFFLLRSFHCHRRRCCVVLVCSVLLFSPECKRVMFVSRKKIRRTQKHIEHKWNGLHCMRVWAQLWHSDHEQIRQFQVLFMSKQWDYHT